MRFVGGPLDGQEMTVEAPAARVIVPITTRHCPSEAAMLADAFAKADRKPTPRWAEEDLAKQWAEVAYTRARVDGEEVWMVEP